MTGGGGGVVLAIAIVLVLAAIGAATLLVGLMTSWGWL